jgi:mannose-6-phosphate isomerase-like protein (cupin superfamily)
MPSTPVPPQEIQAFGWHVSFLATGVSTDGACSIIRANLPARRLGAPRHYHGFTTESFYILQGSLTLLEDQCWKTYSPGELVTVRPGVLHAFRNDADTPVEFLIITTPGGHERLLLGLARMILEEGEWPPSDPAKLVEFGRENDTVYVL